MPKSQKKQRTISYLRATWARPSGMSLQEALGRCTEQLPDLHDTRLPLRDGHAEVRHWDLNRRWVRLHVAAWTDGEPASTVPHAANDLQIQMPDASWDYLDGDGMMLVSDDHCLLMPSGLHPKSLERYVQLLLAHGRDEHEAGIPEHIESFGLLPVANEQIVQQIRRQGVKKINLNVGQYMETARRHEDTGSTIIRQLGRAILETLLEREEDRRQIEEAANVQAKLIITCDTRRPGIQPEHLTPIAAGIAAENEQDIEIETGTGQRIKQGQVVLKKPVEVASFGKTVHHGDAWDQMAQYFDELREGGMLEE